MKIQEIMAKPVVTCRVRDTLNMPAQLMWEHDCGAIPVVNPEGRVVGMITDRDICMAAYTKGCALDAIRVGDVMSHPVFCCHASDTLESAEELMSREQIRRIPVVDDDQRPIGLLSLNDIARYAATSRKKNGFAREVAQTLAAVGQPRLKTAPSGRKASSSRKAAKRPTT